MSVPAGTAPGRARARVAEARIEDLDHEGRGVARLDGKVTFVEGALPGELVRLRVRRRRRSFDEASVEAVLEPSADRVEPCCPHFGRCGGCRLQHLAPPAQVERKAEALLATLERVGGVAPGRVLAPLTGPPEGYRRRARLGARFVAGKGRVVLGFRERHTSLVADLELCRILVPEVGGRIAGIRDALGDLLLRDRVPQVEVAAGDEAAALVVRHLDPLPGEDRERLRALARATGLAVLVQAGGPETATALEPSPAPRLAYALPAHGLELEFGPTDFVQVNAAVNRALVDLALELAGPLAGARLLDLYCGIGNFGLAAARAGARVVGVEGDPALVERARGNARRNRISGVELHAGDLAQPAVAARFLAGGAGRMILDPPRSGAAEVVAALAPGAVERIVYVSCNPATLARDAATLVGEKGYRLAAAGLVDMFPHTAHAEAVALFEAR